MNKNIDKVNAVYYEHAQYLTALKENMPEIYMEINTCSAVTCIFLRRSKHFLLPRFIIKEIQKKP